MFGQVDGLSKLHVFDVKIDAGDDVKLACRVSSIISGMIVVAVRHHQPFCSQTHYIHVGYVSPEDHF